MFKFSVRNYYLLVSVLLLNPITWGLLTHSWFPIICFISFAFAGVLGEALFSVWWHNFYLKKFWTYRVETLVHGYTSLLNFIPWGMGGLLYLKILAISSPSNNFVSASSNTVSPNVPFYAIFSVGFLAGLLIQILSFGLFRKNRRFSEVTLGNYLFFNLPFIVALISCTALYGNQFLRIAFYFAVIGAFTEYLFGKAVEFFISKKLWIYNYFGIDNGHFTLLSLLPFSLAGFYFWTIALILQYIH